MHIISDVHTHSVSSGHATVSTISDMARSAAAQELQLLGITDHGPATKGAGTPSYFRNLSLAPDRRFGIEMLYGVELNILDSQGHVDLTDTVLNQLDYAIAGLHQPLFSPQTREVHTETYIRVMKHPRIKIIAHPDDVKYPVDYELFVKAAGQYKILPEINESSLTPDGYRGDTRSSCIELLKYCQQYDQPVILSSDSHGTTGIGRMPHALALLKQIRFPEHLILNQQPEKLKKFLTT